MALKNTPRAVGAGLEVRLIYSEFRYLQETWAGLKSFKGGKWCWEALNPFFVPAL